MDKKKAIVLDIDGVILNTAFLFEEIFNLKLKGTAMWDYFHEHCNSDRVKVMSNFKPFYDFLIARSYSDIDLILLTSRNEKVKEGTKEKLREEGIYYDKIFMRPNNDYREASTLKKETLHELQKEYNIVLFVDDDLKNCEAAKELGIYTVRKV